MASQEYALLFCTVGGTLLTEAASINVSFATNDIPIHTLAKGFAGMSQGASTITVQVESAVPSAAFEFDPMRFMQSRQPVEMGIIGPGGSQMNIKGFITEGSLQQSTGAEVKLSFSVTAPFTVFE